MGIIILKSMKMVTEPGLCLLGANMNTRFCVARRVRLRDEPNNKLSGTIFHEPCILGRTRRVRHKDAPHNLTSWFNSAQINIVLFSKLGII